MTARLPRHRFVPPTDKVRATDGQGTPLCGARWQAGKLCGLPESMHVRVDEDRNVSYLGIDGEGQTDGGKPGNPHRYVLLAASTEDGSREWYIEDARGLSSVACLDFIIDLPHKRSRIGAYSFGYDLTKILEDMPDALLYKLFRPSTRRVPSRPEIIKPITWWTTAADGSERCYMLNLLNTRFTARRMTGHSPTTGKPVFTAPQTVHDVWRFFQGKFVSALEDWRIGTEEARALMRHMKDRRSDFDKESLDDVRSYCFSECRYMAELFRRLVEAHEAVGLQLTSYFGAGSSAAAMLKTMGVAAHIKEARALRRQSAKVAKVEDRMREPVASAFFGGRFENSVIGAVKGPLYSYDISSAYPYQLCFLPCLLHGRWSRTTRRDRIEGRNIRAALVRYALGKPQRNTDSSAWGPFPFRLDTGAIVYPRVSGGGWVWRDEYLRGEQLFPNVQFREAWIYQCGCDCRPFGSIPRYYAERLRIGKEGPGIVLKLGCNSCYGKLAQSLGGMGQFTSWIWAGLITSGTRAQLLQAIGLHTNRADALSVATDGIVSRTRLTMPAPRETGTGGPEVVNERGEPANKPLGGWEEKVYPRGVFFSRPGISFTLNPTDEDLKNIRGRGVGRGTVREHWKDIMTAYVRALRRGEVSEALVRIATLQRFIGAKTAITPSTGKQGERVYTRSPLYGRWAERPVEMSFDPLPKRDGVLPDGRLKLRSFPGVESIPYRRGILSAEAIALKAAQQEAEEQPDGGDLASAVFE